MTHRTPNGWRHRSRGWRAVEEPTDWPLLIGAIVVVAAILVGLWAFLELFVVAP